MSSFDSFFSEYFKSAARTDLSGPIYLCNFNAGEIIGEYLDTKTPSPRGLWNAWHFSFLNWAAACEKLI